jgi:hypothetical protein
MLGVRRALMARLGTRKWLAVEVVHSRQVGQGRSLRSLVSGDRGVSQLPETSSCPEP